MRQEISKQVQYRRPSIDGPGYQLWTLKEVGRVIKQLDDHSVLNPTMCIGTDSCSDIISAMYQTGRELNWWRLLIEESAGPKNFKPSHYNKISELLHRRSLASLRGARFLRPENA
jgi:hypothetical protein